MTGDEDLRILLFSSMITVLNGWASGFANIDHQFIIVILVPKQQKKEYENALVQFDWKTRPNVTLCPIFLESPNEKLSNLLNPLKLFHDFREIYRTLASHRPDAVIGIYVIHAYPLVLLKRLLGYTLFVMIAGGDVYLHQSLVWKIIRKIIYSNSQVVFTVGHRLKAEIEQESNCRVMIIPPDFLDSEYFRPNDDTSLRRKYGLSASDFVVLTLSFLNERKRVNDVISAVRQLKNKHKNVKMLVAGDGPEKSNLMQLRDKLRLKETITFTGFVDEATKRDLFNIADVYVLVSHHEGLPVSLLEAMSCECICVCSNVGDMPYVIQDSSNGFLIRPREPELLATKIEEIMGRPTKELSTIRKRARQTILEKYASKEWTNYMIDTIENETVNRRTA